MRSFVLLFFKIIFKTSYIIKFNIVALSLHLEEKFGTIVESEIELGNFSNDKAGVVDLITYKKDTDELYLIEFEPNYSENTLLSAALKIQTHYQTIDKEKLVNDFYSKEDSPIPSKNPKIKKCWYF